MEKKSYDRICSLFEKLETRVSGLETGVELTKVVQDKNLEVVRTMIGINNARLDEVRKLIEVDDKNYNYRFENSKEASQLALASAEKAIAKAEMATEKRLDNVNEFRQTLQDQNKTFIARTEFEAKFEGIEKNRKDNTSLIIALIGIIMSIISFLIKLGG